ncbi:MAG: hypothetical protein ACOYLQ_11210 [Hyphomicrobiaceae bacterium]
MAQCDHDPLQAYARLLMRRSLPLLQNERVLPYPRSVLEGGMESVIRACRTNKQALCLLAENFFALADFVGMTLEQEQALQRYQDVVDRKLAVDPVEFERLVGIIDPLLQQHSERLKSYRDRFVELTAA